MDLGSPDSLAAPSRSILSVNFTSLQRVYLAGLQQWVPAPYQTALHAPSQTNQARVGRIMRNTFSFSTSLLMLSLEYFDPAGAWW
jgi:hypothetical protein